MTGEPRSRCPYTGTQRGLPIGVQLVAPWGRGGRVLRLAGTLESARHGATRRRRGAREAAMKFGAMVASKIADWSSSWSARQLGYDSGWVPDSPMIWSDCATRRWRWSPRHLAHQAGTGVAICATPARTGDRALDRRRSRGSRPVRVFSASVGHTADARHGMSR